MPNYYMVRAMFYREDDFQEFLKKDVVAVGWSAVDFSKYKADELYGVIWENYYKDSQKRSQTIGLHLNQALMFKNIKAEDRIIVPYRSGVLIAEATNVELYSLDAFGLDLANQRKVLYKKDENDAPIVIQRNSLSEGLQRRLRVMGRAVSNLNEFGDELEKVFADCKEFSQSFDVVIRKKEKSDEEEFKEKLLNRLQNGKTYLQTGGRGLEDLVCELMRCEGYESRVLSKRAFPNSADADIEAVKEDSFISQKILVQVKHHHGYSGDWGLRQLNAIKEMENEKYLDYNFILITSAQVGDDVRKKALEMDIDVRDGYDLVDLIYNNIEKLSTDTKRKLGISLVPHLSE